MPVLRVLPHGLGMALALVVATFGAQAGRAAEPVGVVRAGTPEGLPGYALTAEGQLRIASDDKRAVFQCIERQVGARFVWHALPTKRVLMALQAGQLDVAFPMGFTPERARTLRESKPTWDNPDVWLSRRPIRPDDKRLRLAARLGSPQQADLSAEGYGRMVGYFSYDELAKALALDVADAVVLPQSIYQDQRALWPADVQVTRGRARESGFYVTPTDPKGLTERLNRAIERCRAAPPAPGDRP